jgi:predicted  nucleic acid-binding Zn-ribbon protein
MPKTCQKCGSVSNFASINDTTTCPECGSAYASSLTGSAPTLSSKDDPRTALEALKEKARANIAAGEVNRKRLAELAEVSRTNVLAGQENCKKLAELKERQRASSAVQIKAPSPNMQPTTGIKDASHSNQFSQFFSGFITAIAAMIIALFSGLAKSGAATSKKRKGRTKMTDSQKQMAAHRRKTAEGMHKPRKIPSAKRIGY